jgi:hypothetical protein
MQLLAHVLDDRGVELAPGLEVFAVSLVLDCHVLLVEFVLYKDAGGPLLKAELNLYNFIS